MFKQSRRDSRLDSTMLAHWSLVNAYVRAYCDTLLLAHWSVRQKLNHVSSAQLGRSVRGIMRVHLAVLSS